MPSDLGDVLKHARSMRDLTKAEEAELAARIQKGDKSAKDKLVEHNMRLAFRLASDWNGSGLDRDDLVQTAMTGLVRAAGTFDPAKGRFTTYAWKWIYKELWDAVYGSQNTIKRPSGVSRASTAVRDYTQSHPSASIEEIADAIKMPINKVMEALDHAQVVASISDDSFIEVSRDEVEESTELLDLLTLEEREAVSWKYGVYGEECNLQQVADRLSRDSRLGREYTPREAGRLCTNARRKLEAARRTDDTVVCSVDHD